MRRRKSPRCNRQVSNRSSDANRSVYASRWRSVAIRRARSCWPTARREGKITIRGAGADATSIVVSPTGASTDTFTLVEVIEGAALSLERLSVLGGDSRSTLGVLSEGTLNLTDTVIAGHQNGGGVRLVGAVSHIVGSRVSGNSWVLGAGIQVNNSTLIIEDSIVNNNYAFSCPTCPDTWAYGGGGGIAVVRGTASVVRSTLAANGAAYGGGGILVALDGGLTVLDSSVSANGAGWFGGGIWLLTQTAVAITDSTIGNNSAINDGGIRADATISIAGSTIAGNLSENSSGYTGDGSFILQNTILTNNASVGHPDGGNCLGFTLTSAGHNLFGPLDNCTFTPQATDLFVQDAGLAPLVNDGTAGGAYFPLAANSPAIDAGGQAPKGHKQADCLPTDQLGQRRVDACDIGAVEFVPSDRRK